mmetsp:Transcript_24799/g.62764  ORF Transcript_24799/g.62764 Transcript_24799/m.62764 type:complete len:232 (-) Transcript_24799:687-1382(-)
MGGGGGVGLRLLVAEGEQALLHRARRVVHRAFHTVLLPDAVATVERLQFLCAQWQHVQHEHVVSCDESETRRRHPRVQQEDGQRGGRRPLRNCARLRLTPARSRTHLAVSDSLFCQGARHVFDHLLVRGKYYSLLALLQDGSQVVEQRTQAHRTRRRRLRGGGGRGRRQTRGCPQLPQEARVEERQRGQRPGLRECNGRSVARIVLFACGCGAVSRRTPLPLAARCCLRSR